MKRELFFTMRDDGTIVNRDQVGRFLKSHPAGRFLLKSEPKNKRSLPQNAYLHGVMLPIVKDALRDAGWNHVKTIEDAKDFVKIKFLAYDVVNEKSGEIQQFFKNTSELTKEEFSILIDDVAYWLWEFFQIKLPYPNEQVSMFE